MAIDEKQAARIEKIGIYFEKFKLPPLAARIMALLLVSEPPYRSFEEIMAQLYSGKSSVSASLNLLMREGMVDYQTFPGDKKRYFQVNSKTWLEMHKERTKQISEFSQLLKSIAETRSPNYPEFNQTLLDMHVFYGEVEEAMQIIMDRWMERESKKL